ncbi:MAG: zinc ribbon-containing protein [Deltaproteobacteria bacterium]|nr:zinc ribbon-containing protein [Deltaproteobacteria bacterium]
MEEQRQSEKEKKEVGLYEKLASRSKELIGEAKEKTSGTIDKAIEKAKEEMVVAGDFSHEQGEKLKAFLKRDLEVARKGINKAGHAAKEALEPHRLAAGFQGILATILEVVGEVFEEWGAKLEANLDYKTGELSTPGSLTCKKCGNIIKIHDTGHIPPCPKCRGVEFHKSY